VPVVLANARASLIPVALIGTFAAVNVPGFSMIILTMFAVALAIGLVVDDAIVVEAVERHVENGFSPAAAAERAVRLVSGPVIVVALVIRAPRPWQSVERRPPSRRGWRRVAALARGGGAGVG